MTRGKRLVRRHVINWSLIVDEQLKLTATRRHFDPNRRFVWFEVSHWTLAAHPYSYNVMDKKTAATFILCLVTSLLFAIVTLLLFADGCLHDVRRIRWDNAVVVTHSTNLVVFFTAFPKHSTKTTASSLVKGNTWGSMANKLTLNGSHVSRGRQKTLLSKRRRHLTMGPKHIRKLKQPSHDQWVNGMFLAPDFCSIHHFLFLFPTGIEVWYSFASRRCKVVWLRLFGWTLATTIMQAHVGQSFLLIRMCFLVDANFHRFHVSVDVHLRQHLQSIAVLLLRSFDIIC